MKTIKLLHYAKYPVLLFIAFFGILIGGSQNAPRPYTSAEIGGNGAGTAPRNFVSNDQSEIGGGQTAPRSPLMSGNDIGGTQSPPRSYAVANIGGIGGGQTALRPTEGLSEEIGGSQTAPRGYHKSSDPIGGNSAPRSFAYHCMEIGGGGNETRKIFVNAISDGEDIENDALNASQFSYFPTANSAVQYSVYDFSDADFDFKIGGNSTQGNETRRLVINEIGGGQTAPRELMEIGGNQTAPRQFEIGGQTVPSSRPLMLASVDDIGGNFVPRAASLINGFPEIGGAQGAPRQ